VLVYLCQQVDIPTGQTLSRLMSRLHVSPHSADLRQFNVTDRAGESFPLMSLHVRLEAGRGLISFPTQTARVRHLVPVNF